MATSSESKLQLIITGDNQSATEAIDGVAKGISDLSETVSSLMSRLAEAATSLGDFGRSIAEMGDSIAGASGRLSTLGSDASKQAQMVAESANEMTKSFSDVGKVASDAADTAVKSFDTLNTAVRQTATTTSEATRAIESEAGALRTQSEALDTAAKAASTYHQDQMLGLIGIQMLGASMTEVGVKGAELFAGAIKSAMDFQAMMSRVGAALKTTGGDTAQNIKNLSNLAMQLDQTSLFSMNDISDMMQALAKQGLSYQQIYGGAAKATITLAQATDTSLTDTGTVITDVIHEFNLNGSQMTPVINAISGALHQANISMSDFYNSMKYVGPLASQLGLNVNDVSQALGLLAQHGIKGSQAGTTLRRMLMNLQPSTAAATAEFKQLGLVTANGTNLFYNANGTLKSMGDIVDILHSHLEGLTAAQKENALRTMFGVYALSGMEVIAGTTKQRWDALTQSMANTSAAEVAAQKMNNLQGHLKEFTSTLQTIGTQMATFMMPILNNIVEGLQGLAGKFKDLAPWMQHAIFIIVGVGSALAILAGTLLTTAAAVAFMRPGWVLIGETISNVGTRIGTFITETIPNFVKGLFTMSTAEEEAGVAANGMLGIWGLVIAGVITLVTLLITHWQQVVQWVQQNFGINIPQVLKAMGQIFSDVWNGIKNAVDAAWNYIQPTLMQGITAISNFWRQIWPELQQIFQAAWQAMKVIIEVSVLPMWITMKIALQAFQAAWSSIWDLIKAAFKLTWDTIETIVKVAWDLVSGIIEIGLALLTGHWSTAWKDLQTMALNIWNALKDGIGNIVQDLQNVVMDAINALIKGVLGAFDGLVTAAQNIWNKIVSIFSQKPPTPQMPSVPSASTATPNIPHFAAGGIVTKPTLAVLGEGGSPEAVVPLQGLNNLNGGGYSVGLPSNLSRAGMGGNNVTIGNINITVPNGDANKIAQALKVQLSRAIS
ncbi:phage tail tape measure protein [Alicyclobacillus cycloheptanicus]|uniref:TP901 family phage tail tape measure protein n=1 Tax=Alicyclobacillus cycloheptanicus TaxID=1457 RepID=A0ABT9XD97_9BACL|nr:phage tail tape measure protein [Alicyclobacillus cycloheptanicus]MDQ0188273.1 TP901 family phage tail tape measure protein [Alicyclobacillus cycloheptanicus]WDM00992.1 phage tail tape measure protein [Alicyclobacillus cycloheptanicus]